jgi:hypothetical protein
MPQYNVHAPLAYSISSHLADHTRQITLAKDASHDELDKAKQHVKDQGGKIVRCPPPSFRLPITDARFPRSTSSP